LIALDCTHSRWAVISAHHPWAGLQRTTRNRNEFGWQKSEQHNSWQQAKHTKLYSDLLQELTVFKVVPVVVPDRTASYVSVMPHHRLTQQ